MTLISTCHLKHRHNGVVLVYSLLVLSVILMVATALSLYVVRQIRNASLSSQTATAHYLAEAGVEEGLFIFRQEQDQTPAFTAADLADPFGSAHQLARIASSTAEDSNDRPFSFASPAWAELFATTTINEIILDVNKDELAYADVYDASQQFNTTAPHGAGVGSIKLEWDSRDDSSWLEVSLVGVNISAQGGALQNPDTILLGPTARTGSNCYLSNLLNNLPLSNFYRLRFRALEGDIHSLKITGFDGNSCNGNTVSLPGRLTINSTGRYQQAKQTVQVSMPQQKGPSGLFGFVLFSDQPLVKLNIGQGNLKFWPRPLPGPSGDTFTFKNLDNPNPSVSTTVAQLYTFANDTTLFYSGANRYPGGEASDNGTAIFTLVNTSISSAIATGEISLAINSSYSGALEIDQSFAQQTIAGKDFIDSPPDSDTNPHRTRLMTCAKLQQSRTDGMLKLEKYGSTAGVDILGPADENGNRPVIDHYDYYADRCAVGVRLNPAGITTGVTGRLLAYGDPGGTASMNLTWTMPGPHIVLPSNINFGTVYVGIPTDHEISVGNDGEISLSVSSINTGSSLVTVTSGNTPFSVPVSGQHNVNFRFSPTQAGSFSGNITVISNDHSSPHTIAWSGNAVMAPPDYLNNWDCWGQGSNIIRCLWAVPPASAYYDLRMGTTCLNEGGDNGVGGTVNTTRYAATTAPLFSYGTQKGIDINVGNDSYFRCFQVRSVDASGNNTSAWTTVRGSTASNLNTANIRRFFLGPWSSGNLRSYDNVGPNIQNEWWEGANRICTEVAVGGGLFNTYKAWMCGSDRCQLLEPNQTYIWMANEDGSGSGASFRTDASGAPPADLWVGIPQTNKWRRHIWTTLGSMSDNYFSGLNSVGTAYNNTNPRSDCPNISSNSWSSNSGVNNNVGAVSQFGSSRWTGNSNPDGCGGAAIYCFEDPNTPLLTKKFLQSISVHNGNFVGDSSLSGTTWYEKADSFCQRDFGTKFPGSTWRALLWNNNTWPPGIITHAAVRYVTGDPNGNTFDTQVFVATSDNNLPTTGPWCSFDQRTWTGRNGGAPSCTMSGSASSCNGWTVGTSASQGTWGECAANTCWYLYYSSILPCDQASHIYCVEQ